MGGVVQSAMLVCAVSYVVVACRIIVTAPVQFWIGTFWTYRLDLGLGNRTLACQLFAFTWTLKDPSPPC